MIEELAGQRLRFWHLTFQEYLAAFTLAQSENWWELIESHLENAQWRETLDLFASCLFDARGASQVDHLLEKILDDAAGGLASEARAAGLVGRFLKAAESCGYQPPPTLRARFQNLLNKALAIFSLAGATQVDISTRIAAAEALGRAGDPRLAPGVNNFKPVPGTAIELGLYPETVEEYRHFVENGGYLDPSYWSAQGWATRTQEGWLAPGAWAEQLKHPNRPVVEVSHAEAEAYCRWLQRLCRRKEVRLPTEEEWLRAATNPAGPFPWGEPEPTPELANFGSNVGAPTPVGIYPVGAGLFEHLDLAGYIWEWCSNALEDGRYPLRGGGWSDPPEGLQSTFRLRGEPDNRYDGFGFRVAVSPASLDS